MKNENHNSLTKISILSRRTGKENSESLYAISIKILSSYAPLTKHTTQLFHLMNIFTGVATAKILETVQCQPG